jgi:hypothetical protein
VDAWAASMVDNSKLRVAICLAMSVRACAMASAAVSSLGASSSPGIADTRLIGLVILPQLRGW